MEEKKNEVLENVEMSEQEVDTEVVSLEDDVQAKNDSVMIFGKPISKKPLIMISAIVAAVLLLAIAIIIIFAKHPLTKFLGQMEKADNYQMTVTMSDIPLFGTLTIQTKVDGNITYTPAILFNEESYTEYVGDDVYKYTKDSDGKWTKEKQESEEESESTSDQFSKDFEDIFNPKNYDKVAKNKYEQKSDVHFESYDDVVIILDDDSCTIEMSAISEGMTFRVKIVISDIGDVELTLPKV